MLTLIRCSELTLKAFYISRYTRQLVTLVNPSDAHLRRLNNDGHEITVQNLDENGTIVKEVLLKY